MSAKQRQGRANTSVARPAHTQSFDIRTFDVRAFLTRHARLLTFALIVIGSIRIVSTYHVFSHTYDEPAHIACGMEYLDKGVYRYEPQHPPLARVAAALGPYLLGARSHNTPPGPIGIWLEGNAILYQNDNYDLMLAAARLGILPFFWIACLVVFWWGKRYFGVDVAVVAVFLFSFAPPILAHAGLATTDMALTAFLPAAFLTGLICLENPSVRHGLLFGAATGLAVLAKLSTLVFLPAAAGLALVWYVISARPGFRPALKAVGERLPSILLAAVTGALVIWAGYRFSFGKVDFTNLHLPAPEFYAGIQQVIRHNEAGHPTYLLGERSRTGFWCFYLVALAVKTPIALLLLMAAGVSLPFRKLKPSQHAYLALAFAAAILAIGMVSRINIGIRHILPIYVGLSLLAAAAALWLWDRFRRQKWGIAALFAVLLWLTVSSLASHPDYLAYFNEFAGSRPENILVDSDLDWGQDMKRLAKRLEREGASSVSFAPMVANSYENQNHMPPLTRMNLVAPMVGWNAVSVTVWKAYRFNLFDSHPEIRPWPDVIRVKPERIGKSILLWYFPPVRR